MISLHFQGKPFNIIVIQVYVPTTYAEEAEVDRFYEELITRPSWTNTENRCSFLCVRDKKVIYFLIYIIFNWRIIALQNFGFLSNLNTNQP